MIDLILIYALLADAGSQSHLPYDLPSLEYADNSDALDEKRRSFEEHERIQDEIFFRSKEPGKDMNDVYFPDSTIKRSDR